MSTTTQSITRAEAQRNCSCEPRAFILPTRIVGDPEVNSALIGAPAVCKYCGKYVHTSAADSLISPEGMA